MGQPVTAVEKPSPDPSVVRFETNRVLTGTGHEVYRAGEPIPGRKWCDELARRIFERGGVTAVHMNGNLATVHLSPGSSADGLLEIIETMFIHYRPGVEVVVPEGAAAE